MTKYLKYVLAIFIIIVISYFLISKEQITTLSNGQQIYKKRGIAMEVLIPKDTSIERNNQLSDLPTVNVQFSEGVISSVSSQIYSLTGLYFTIQGTDGENFKDKFKHYLGESVTDQNLYIDPKVEIDELYQFDLHGYDAFLLVKKANTGSIVMRDSLVEVYVIGEKKLHVATLRTEQQYEDFKRIRNLSEEQRKEAYFNIARKYILDLDL